MANDTQKEGSQQRKENRKAVESKRFIGWRCQFKTWHAHLDLCFFGLALGQRAL
jgi:hypothetical protein